MSLSKQHRTRIIQSLLLKFCIHKLHIKRAIRATLKSTELEQTFAFSLDVSFPILHKTASFCSHCPWSVWAENAITPPYYKPTEIFPLSLGNRLVENMHVIKINQSKQSSVSMIRVGRVRKIFNLGCFERKFRCIYFILIITFCFFLNLLARTYK